MEGNLRIFFFNKSNLRKKAPHFWGDGHGRVQETLEYSSLKLRKINLYFTLYCCLLLQLTILHGSFSNEQLNAYTYTHA